MLRRQFFPAVTGSITDASGNRRFMRRVMGSVLMVTAALSGADASARDDTLTVYTVNYPLAYFAERIGGKHVQVEFPAPADGDPAAWNPEQQELEAFRQADLILLNGAGYETWIAAAGLPEDKLVDTSAGFADRLIVAVEETHSHGPGGAHSHAETTAFTTWLDPELAIVHADAIRDALSASWPHASADFDTGFALLSRDLKALDRDFAELFAALENMPVVFSHPVYQYLERRYGIDAISVHWEPNELPDDNQLMALAAKLVSFPAELMIWEGEPMPGSIEALALMGVNSVAVNPCANRPESGDYLSVMRDNISNLRAALNLEVTTD